MSLEDLNRYQRELERQGLDAQAVGAHLLGVERDRFWLLVEAGDEPRDRDDVCRWDKNAKHVTVFLDDAYWFAAWALDVVSLGRLVDHLANMGRRWVLIWDRKRRAPCTIVQPYEAIAAGMSRWHEQNAARVENGWRDPPPANNRFGSQGGNVTTFNMARSRGSRITPRTSPDPDANQSPAPPVPPPAP